MTDPGGDAGSAVCIARRRVEVLLGGEDVGTPCEDDTRRR